MSKRYSNPPPSPATALARDDDIEGQVIDAMRDALKEDIEPGRDTLKPIYHRLVPRRMRHKAGEYYSPDWLAEFLLDEVGYDGNPAKRLVDPSCGSGTFLIQAIERAKHYGRVHHLPLRETAASIVANIWGFDVKPLAVHAARANYLQALRGLGHDVVEADIPVIQRDMVLDGMTTAPFDFVVGNPPWVRWDYLPAEYREATLPFWKHYGLFSLKGFDTRLGGGKKDFAMLFTYVVADKCLREGGVLGFLLTLELLKAKGAAEGFRRFQLGQDGECLKVIRAHDFSSVQPFEGASNKTAALILTKGEKTAYPVPFIVWHRAKQRSRLPDSGSLREVLPLLKKEELSARPLESECSAWQTLPSGSTAESSFKGTSDYKAMLGANPNPYGVYWLRPQRILPGGDVVTRNLPELGKTALPEVQVRIESELVFPALRGSDISRWRAEPQVHVLVVQDPVTRRGYLEKTMRERWPRTLAYLSRFEEALLARALYKKYHQEQGNPYYSQFNVGPDTFSTYKVVWKRMANDLCATVISSHDGPLGPKLIVPLETTAFIPSEDEEEAHYLCAILNSAPVRGFIRSFSSAGRGFGTPSVIRHIRLPKFDERQAVHRDLAGLSRSLHQMNARSQAGEVEAMERLINERVHEI